MYIISHRGKINSKKYDENNMNSVINFMESNIEFIEIDIQISKDNEIILYHDDKITINNFCLFDCFNKKKISEIDSEYLIDEYNIIYLKKFLDMIKGEKKIYLDIKNDELKDNQVNNFFIELLKILDDYIFKYKADRSSIYIASFYPKYINYIISIPFEYKKGIIIHEGNIEYFKKNYNNTLFDFISIDYNIIDLIKDYQEKNNIFCFTVNNDFDFDKLLKKYNINGIVTDYPEKFLKKYKIIKN